MEREKFTWIGPFTDASGAGRIARATVRALIAAGSPTGALDTGSHARAAAVDDVDLSGPVRWVGTTVVRHAPLSQLATTAAILAPDARARQVAYIVADVAEPPRSVRDLLDRCDEVWAPSTVQLELLCALGVERSRLYVIAPGIDDEPKLASRHHSGHDGPARVLVVGGNALPESSQQEILFVRPDTKPGSPDFAAEIQRADLVLVLDDTCPWGSVALDVLRAGRPLAHVDSGLAAEYAGDDDCAWIPAARARDPHTLLEEVTRLLADRTALAVRAERARARIVRDESPSRSAVRILARRTDPRVLPEPRLVRAMSDLGFPTPLERLSGSRAKVLIVPVAHLDGPWRAALRAQVSSRIVDPEATVCLWVDESCAGQMDAIAAAAEAEIAAAAGAGHDVLVVLAPLAHAPRERFVTSSG